MKITVGKLKRLIREAMMSASTDVWALPIEVTPEEVTSLKSAASEHNVSVYVINGVGDAIDGVELGGDFDSVMSLVRSVLPDQAEVIEQEWSSEMM